MNIQRPICWNSKLVLIVTYKGYQENQMQQILNLHYSFAFLGLILFNNLIIKRVW